MKIVINNCFGGFSVSLAVFTALGKKENPFYGYLCNGDFNIISENPNAYRAYPQLITVIEKIGLEKSSGASANLKIVEVPDDIEWGIDQCDGTESVHGAHRSWS